MYVCMYIVKWSRSAATTLRYSPLRRSRRCCATSLTSSSLPSRYRCVRVCMYVYSGVARVNPSAGSLPYPPPAPRPGWGSIRYPPSGTYPPPPCISRGLLHYFWKPSGPPPVSPSWFRVKLSWLGFNPLPPLRYSPPPCISRGSLRFCWKRGAFAGKTKGLCKLLRSQ